jgi:hypothetical protein
MRFRVLTAAAVAALTVLGVAGGAVASNSFSYDDPAGDSASAADLTGIVVSNTDTGTITFALTYANRPDGLGDDDQLQVWLDTDENNSTGDQFGFDYVIAVDKGGAILKHGTPAGFEDAPASTLSPSADGKTVSVNRSDLGNTAKFDFFVRAVAKSDLSGDDAPDSSNQVFVYSLAAPRLNNVLVAFSPKTPKAGKTFTALVLLARFDDGSTAGLPKTVSCKGTLNDRPIAGRAQSVRCVWKLPRSSKGKRFSFKITISVNGAQATFGPWRFKVR